MVHKDIILFLNSLGFCQQRHLTFVEKMITLNKPDKAADFYVGRTLKDDKLDHIMNFDFKTATFNDFNQVCFSTCCWTFLISPDKKK